MSVSNTDIGAYKQSPSVPSQKGSKKTVQYGKFNLGYWAHHFVTNLSSFSYKPTTKFYNFYTRLMLSNFLFSWTHSLHSHSHQQRDNGIFSPFVHFLDH